METKEPQLPLLSIGDLWRIFRQCWLLMLIVAIGATGGLVVLNRLLPRRYASTATLYILRQGSDDQLISDDFSLALNVVSDCSHLLKSHSVLDAVIDNLSLDISYRDLRQCITTNNPENTRILEVTAEADSPTLAKSIVDAICVIGTEKISQTMGFAQVNLYEYGVWDSMPSNRVTTLHCALTFAAAAAAIYGVYLVLYLLRPPEPKKPERKVVKVTKKSQ